MNNNTTNDNARDFASLFEKSLAKMDTLAPGQEIETAIVSISNDCIFLELGGKSEGVLDAAEMLDKDGKLTVKVGDVVKVFFLDSRNGERRFTARIRGDDANRDLLENAFRNGIPVDGLVEKEIKGGFEVKIGEMRAFCPFSQMGGKRQEGGEAAESPVGKRLVFKILEYGEKGRKILLSNRAIAEEERQKRLEKLKESLHEGMTVTGTVKSVQDFGAFVDVSGFQALLPVSEISRERVSDVRQAISAGQEITASIIKLDWKAERMTLSMKELLADPWDGAFEKYPKGSKHKGKVSRVTNFGAFVTLESGIDGLVHASELSGDAKYPNAQYSLKVGEAITVLILGVDAESKRISLKQASSVEEDETAKAYLDTDGSVDTYNPFAALLKDKAKKR